MASAPEATSRRYLNDLDRQAAQRHFRKAVYEAGMGGDRIADIARRELRDDWDKVDGFMESTAWPGGGRNRHMADFTEWDGMKKLVGDTAHKVVEQAPVQWRAMTDALLDEDPKFARLSNRELRDDARIHANFAHRYGEYALRDSTLPLAAEDGRQAFRQVGMLGRDAFEVASRAVGDRALPPIGRLVFRTRDGAGREMRATRPVARATSTDGTQLTAKLLGAATIAGASAAAGIAFLEHEVRAVRRRRVRQDSTSNRSTRQIGAG